MFSAEYRARGYQKACGTGGHAIELARNGFEVTELDASCELIAEARRKAPAGLALSWQVGDILALNAKANRFDAILCRGVLNDFCDEAARRRVFHVFADLLCETGLLIFDVRDWDATASRKLREPQTVSTIEASRGLLTFRVHDAVLDLG